MRVASLHVYPVKGTGGITLERAEILVSGIRHDRRFMVLDAEGKFVSQREHPRMALVDVSIESDRLTLSVPGAQASVPLVPEGSPRRARVWDDDVDAIDVGGDGAAFFSDYLGQSCSLVFMPPDAVRVVEAPYGKPDDRVGFTDGYPVLVASLASLADLNARLQKKGASPVPMNRFRPSIVIDGGEPYAEDRAATMRVGDVTLRTPKRCARCSVTTVDQATGIASKEPLKTLASYRTEGKNVWFAMNAIPDLAPGASTTIAVGDPIVFD
jgi:uncharacterized protein